MEGALNRDLGVALEQELLSAVVLKIADRITSGIPDISVNWQEAHVWIETKLANPSFVSKGIQERMMRRLGSQGEAWYVIYDAKPTKSVYIVSPVITLDPRWVKSKKWKTDFAFHIDGWDHREVARHMRTILHPTTLERV